MRAEQVLSELKSRGVKLRAAGDRIRFHPVEAVPPELVEELRAHKEELLRLLLYGPPVSDALGGVSEARPSLLDAEVCSLRLEDFAIAGLVIEVRSDVLRETVVFASDDARVDPGELRPVYRARELRVLLGLTDPRELRRIHEVKRTFRGTITDASPGRC